MPRGKNCRETVFAAQLPHNTLTKGAILKEENMSSLVGRGNLGGILRDNLGEGNESQHCRETVGSQFCREASRCLAGPSGHSWDTPRTFGPEGPERPLSLVGGIASLEVRGRPRFLSKKCATKRLETSLIDKKAFFC